MKSNNMNNNESKELKILRQQVALFRKQYGDEYTFETLMLTVDKYGTEMNSLNTLAAFHTDLINRMIAEQKGRVVNEPERVGTGQFDNLLEAICEGCICSYCEKPETECNKCRHNQERCDGCTTLED